MKNEVVEDLSNITNNETNKENFKNQTLVRKIDKEKYDSEGLMTETMNVNAAGQYPTALNQEAFINRDNIPLVGNNIFGVSDALGYSGIDWDVDIKPFVDPSRVGVFLVLQ